MELPGNNTSPGQGEKGSLWMMGRVGLVSDVGQQGCFVMLDPQDRHHDTIMGVKESDHKEYCGLLPELGLWSEEQETWMEWDSWP